ncbi:MULTISPECIES: hypothetical protein [unclassified Lentimicrobium]|uniref:hypothetical protein n=1 Tax=unclassified Lentimicrobium TaxID=2677434 RepID=UPI001555BE24|nr:MULTISPECIES: hypothetical protein [unclassified Lentimicrobium]NPD46515.1 hypothetical protein [Lentimicrobium sp. S6]NPD85164.1 hypothetical protein [Lentimicrobium sp. L6]
MSEFKEFYQTFLDKLEEARKAQDSVTFQKLMHVVEPNWQQEDQEIFADYCQTKAGLYALFGENLDMDDWMSKALQFSNSEMHTHIYFKWLSLYFHQLRALTKESKIKGNFSSIFNVSEQAIKLEKDYYTKLAFESMRILSLAALGKHDEVKQEIQSLNLKDVPSKLVNDSTKLQYFYANIYKLLVATLEIRDAKLLEKILKMITIDDALMASSAPLFRKFNTVVMDLADMRPEMAADFNYFYQMRKQWSGFLPNFSLFTMMIEEENVKGLDFFFDSL